MQDNTDTYRVYGRNKKIEYHPVTDFVLLRDLTKIRQ